MSLLRTKGLQIGQDGTASNNFTLYQPGVPDGTLRIGNGNNGSVTDAITLSSSGNVGIGTATTSNGNLTIQKASATTDAPVLTLWNSGSSGGSTSGYLKFYNDTSVRAELSSVIDSDAPYAGNFIFKTGQSTLTERMRIDSSGRVTMPYQPAFLAYTSQTGDVTISVGSDYVLDQTKYNVGGHYNTSNGRFTAPVAGLYEFNMHIYFTNSGGNTQVMGAAYRVNGGAYSGVDAIGHTQRVPDQCGGVITGESTLVLQLNASDYVTIFARTNNNRIYRGHTHFSGRLIG